MKVRHARSLCAALFLCSWASWWGCEPPPKEDLEAKARQEIKADTSGEAPKLRYEGSTLSEEEQDQTLALINGQPLTLGEYERRLNTLAPFARARYNTPERKKEFLDQLIQFEVLAQEAQRRGYDKDPSVVLEMKQAMVRKLLEEGLDNAPNAEVPKDEVKAYYEAHLDDYVRPAQVRASQIVLPDQATAEKVKKDLEAEFAKDPTKKRRFFAIKAREVSTDKTTAELGGDMRFFAHPKDGGTVPAELADPVFALEDVGGLAGPIQTPQGWHLLMLTARKQRYERTFEEVERNIANRLAREKHSLGERKFIDDLKAKAKVELHPEHLPKIPDPQPPQEGEGHQHEDAFIPGDPLQPPADKKEADEGGEGSPKAPDAGGSPDAAAPHAPDAGR